MNNILEETMGQRIKAQRKRLGMTQEQLAEIMLLPKSTISAYENDKVDLKASMITALADVLQTDPNYLLGYKSKGQEMLECYEQIEDLTIREALLVQIKALCSMSKKNKV